VKLLKSINPAVMIDQQSQHQGDYFDITYEVNLPMDSGRALAVAFLELAIGINTGRPTKEDEFDSLALHKLVDQRIANSHDKRSYLLLEGVISEQGDNPAQKQEDMTTVGKLYREKLLQFLRWPLAKVQLERLLNSLPKSSLQEHALVLG
jgi:hypothetical protein